MKNGTAQPKSNSQNADSFEKTKANRQLCLSILKNADSLLEDGDAESALVEFCNALKAEPGRISVIHRIGQCLELSGAADDAALCYRGVIPDSVNQEHFDSINLSELVVPAIESDSVEVKDAYAYDTVKLTAPLRNPNSKKKFGQFNYAKTEARASFCTVASQGSVWFDGFNTLALDREGRVLIEHTKGNEFACYPSLKNLNPIALDGTACFLDARSSVIYYHWMLDVLPKLGVLERAGIALDSIDYFIVGAKSKFQLETLEACGVAPEKIITTPVPRYYAAENMIVPYLRNDVGEKFYQGLGVGLASWVPKFLQQRLQSVDNNNPAKRIYVSRSSRGARNIANEAEIIEALKERGFETVEFENYSVAEQAELMGNVEMVIGVHGAGFTNLSFCKPGTRVIEIFGDYVVPCYWTLSAVAGLDYAQFMASSVHVDSREKENPGKVVQQLRDLQIEVDPAEFIAFVDSILAVESGSSTKR